jgi:hypothetical protein
MLAFVEMELGRFVSKGLGYKGSDLRWRHVVTDCKEGCLLDLESLEDLSTDMTKAEAVKFRVASLQNRMG